MQLLIKPVSAACNMMCRYCFYEDEARNRDVYSYGNMSRETAHRLIDCVYEIEGKNVDFGFQGGEPSMAGISFFEDFVSYARSRKPEKVKLSFTMQTNGLELDEEFLDFLKREQFLVGISLDGPKRIHDNNRIDRKGQGTFLRIADTIKGLQERKIDFHVLTVLTDRNAMQIEKIYRFLCGQNLLFQQYIPCMEPLELKEQDTCLLHPVEYGEALKRLFDAWFQDYKQGNYVYIRQFENWVGMLKGCEPEACAMSGSCNIQNVVEANGDIYACDFYVLEKYRLGNIYESSLGDLLQKGKNGIFIREAREKRERNITECSNCEVYKICRGGCTREYENGKNRFCEAYREFFRYARERLYWLTTH